MSSPRRSAVTRLTQHVGIYRTIQQPPKPSTPSSSPTPCSSTKISFGHKWSSHSTGTKTAPTNNEPGHQPTKSATKCYYSPKRYGRPATLANSTRNVSGPTPLRQYALLTPTDWNSHQRSTDTGNFLHHSSTRPPQTQPPTTRSQDRSYHHPPK